MLQALCWDLNPGVFGTGGNCIIFTWFLTQMCRFKSQSFGGEKLCDEQHRCHQVRAPCLLQWWSSITTESESSGNKICEYLCDLSMLKIRGPHYSSQDPLLTFILKPWPTRVLSAKWEQRPRDSILLPSEGWRSDVWGRSVNQGLDDKSERLPHNPLGRRRCSLV
jgi:hypothetical protein